MGETGSSASALKLGSPELGWLGLGCWAFGGAMWGGQEDEDSRAAMRESFAAGVRHFDTATGYGNGRSETLVGEFLQGRRDQLFVATKAFPANVSAEFMLQAVDESRARLRTDTIDLYYIHWPRAGQDMRPSMEGLERAREQGKIRAIGVSNFSVEQMEQVSQVGRIDAHQLCYNLFWRHAERDLIPYCREKGIAVVTYSSIAEGILTGKFGRELHFAEDDHRASTALFQPEVWPHVYEAVERLKGVASRAGRPLAHLAMRWVAAQPGVDHVLVGARNAEQARSNVGACAGDVPEEILREMTAISDEVRPHIPVMGNIFGINP